MLRNTWKLVFLIAAVHIFVVSAESEDESSSFEEPTFNKAKTYESPFPSDSPEPPPPASALSSLGPLLSLLQPIIGGIFNGPGTDPETSATTYPPLLKPIFSPLPLLPGLGIIPSSLAAQASDLLASSAADARRLFAKAARENALRSQMNYGHILSAINEANNPAEEAS